MNLAWETLDTIPTILFVGMVVQGLSLAVLLCLLGFVWWAMPTD